MYYEVTEIELIDNSTNSITRSNESVSVPSVTGTKLLENVVKSYDRGKKTSQRKRR